MYKTRFKRLKNIRVDMIAMCDVAFLILLFFISASRFKRWEPVAINLPGISDHIISDPDGYFATILIAGNKVMYEIPDTIKEQTLSAMSSKYKISFSEDEKLKFRKMDVIGAPVAELKHYINNYYDQRLFFDRLGIPYTSANSELSQWIAVSQNVAKEAMSRPLIMVIKADKNVKYPVIKQVINILQCQHINRFKILAVQNNDYGK